MKFAAILAVFGMATGANADVSCTLGSPSTGGTSTLLIRDLGQSDEAVILIADRAMIFECPPRVTGARSFECYGRTSGAVSAPTQLNISSSSPEPGAIVVASIRNEFFGRNEHIGYHRRIASLHMFNVESCDVVGTSVGSSRLLPLEDPPKAPHFKDK